MPHQQNFLANTEDITPTQIILHDDEHHHLSRVLRHKSGDRVWVTDGQGVMFSGTILEIGKRRTIVEIDQQFRNYGEEPFRLILAQALPKASRFEWLLEKGTEIGVAAFWPMVTQFSTVKSEKNNLVRWQRIIKAAVKQCGRSVLPAIEKPQSFGEILEKAGEFEYRWIAHTPAPETVKMWSSHQPIEWQQGENGLLLIGPEGGFSEEEVEQAAQADFVFLDLGKRRLRSETAGIVAASLLLSQ